MEINRIPRKVALAMRAITQIERPDRTPVAIPEGYGTPLSLEDRLRLFVRQELSQAASEEGRERFQEADDLEFEEEDALLSPFQVQDMVEEFLPAEPAEKESDSESSVDSARSGVTEPSGENSVEESSEAPPASNPPPG